MTLIELDPNLGDSRIEEAAMPVDLNSIKKTDLGALVAGALALLVSLFPSFLTASLEGAGDLGVLDSYDGGGVSAWNGAGALGMLLVLAATALVAVKVFAQHVLPTGVPFNLVAAALAGLGTLILVLRILTKSESVESFGVTASVGPGWSGILLLLLTIALTVCTALGFKGSGEALPWHNSGSAATGGQAGRMGNTQGTGYAAPGTAAPTAPPSTAQQPTVQPTTPQHGAPMSPPSGTPQTAPPPRAPGSGSAAPGSPAPGAPGSGGSVPSPGEEQPRNF
jgi:hypothetical protein